MTLRPAKAPPGDLHRYLVEFVDVLIQHEIDLNFAKRELESCYIRQILTQHDGHIGHSAKELGMHRNTLSKRMKELGIATP